ncbi:hypothetical protein, partial [Pseudomonas defluvii]|uniref:hypothetical protein n=1 Tax=Pseudomonas defluvii TaxID=1876757 RepID=UPI0039064667
MAMTWAMTWAPAYTMVPIVEQTTSMTRYGFRTGQSGGAGLVKLRRTGGMERKGLIRGVHG